MNDADSVLLSVSAEARQLVAPDDKETGRVEPSGPVTATVALRVTVRDLDTLDDLSGVLAAHPSLNVYGVMWHVDWDNPAWPQVRTAAIGAAIRKAGDYAAALGARLRQVAQSRTARTHRHHRGSLPNHRRFPAEHVTAIPGHWSTRPPRTMPGLPGPCWSQRAVGGGSMMSAACRSARAIRSRGLTCCSSSTSSANRSRNGVMSRTPGSPSVLATRPALAA